MLVDQIEPHFAAITERLRDDPEYNASAHATITQGTTITFGICSQSDARTSGVIVKIAVHERGNVQTELFANHEDPISFALYARPADWRAFFRPKHELVRPYQSYWGMLRVLGPLHKKVHIGGDTTAFAKYARLWRIVLDRMRDVVNSQPVSEAILPGDEDEDDCIVGKYVWVEHSEYGKVKIFYETSGTGPGTGRQIILFLHTAGSDSRQYHSLMNSKALRKECTMYAFDLPGHGRSTLGTKQVLEDYSLTEASYLESIRLVIEKLKLSASDNLIFCGASMAGHVCLAAAIRARELGVRGVIPCEGCAHLPLSQPIYEMKGNDSAILDPERVCGMIAPTSPEYYKQQIWWQYSSQGTGVFAGDLKFYFKGWDGRDRMSRIDTQYCPVYMLTGEYDYSCTTEASAETARMIKGAKFEAMKGLGHFPLTENPKAVLPYLLKAVKQIQKEWDLKEEEDEVARGKY